MKVNKSMGNGQMVKKKAALQIEKAGSFPAAFSPLQIPCFVTPEIFADSVPIKTSKPGCFLVAIPALEKSQAFFALFI